MLAIVNAMAGAIVLYFMVISLVAHVSEKRAPTIKFLFSIGRFCSEVFQGDPSALLPSLNAPRTNGLNSGSYPLLNR